MKLYEIEKLKGILHAAQSEVSFKVISTCLTSQAVAAGFLVFQLFEKRSSQTLTELKVSAGLHIYDLCVPVGIYLKAANK